MPERDDKTQGAWKVLLISSLRTNDLSAQATYKCALHKMYIMRKTRRIFTYYIFQIRWAELPCCLLCNTPTRLLLSSHKNGSIPLLLVNEPGETKTKMTDHCTRLLLGYCVLCLCPSTFAHPWVTGSNIHWQRQGNGTSEGQQAWRWCGGIPSVLIYIPCASIWG